MIENEEKMNIRNSDYLKEKLIESQEVNKKYWKRNIWISYFISFFISFHLISGVLVPFFTEWGNISFVQIMFLQSYFTIMIFVFEIPCGAIADHISRKFSMILGCFVNVLASIIYSLYPNFLLFMLGETFWALSVALISGTDQAFMYDTLKKLGQEEKMSEKTANYRTSMLISVGLSAPVGSIIGQVISLPMTMFLMCIPFSLATLFSVLLKEPNHELIKTEKKNYLKLLKSGVSELMENKILRLLAIELISVEAVVFFLIWTYQVYLEDLGIALAFYGFVSGGMTLAQVVMTKFLPKLGNRFNNKRRFMRIITIIPGASFVLMALVFFPPVSIILILVTIGIGFSRSILFVKGINSQIQSENRATVLSTVNMLGNLIRTVLYPLIGFLVVWNLSCTFLLLGGLIVILGLSSRIQNEYL